MARISLFLCVFFIISSCKTMSQEAVTQGITGQVLWVEGNQMPGPDRKNDPGKTVKREIVIYEALKMDDAEGSMPLFDAIDAEPVKVVETAENGIFTIDLKPGTYSVFTREEDNKLFANRSDSEGFINTVTVNKNELTEIIITINYKAAY